MFDLFSADVAIPDVAGKDLTKAISVLQDAGFKVADEQEEVTSDEVEEGDVVKTMPAAGSKKSKGTTVTIYVSTGSSKIEILDYTGKNYYEVKGNLEAHGINVIVEKKEVDSEDEYEASEIIDQSVEDGKKLGSGDTITLYIPNIVTKYPDFTDGTYTIEDVEAFCEEYGITLKITYVENDGSYEVDTIIDQSRKEGYTVARNTTLTIKVADEVTSGDEEISDECNPLEEDCE